MLEIIIVNRIVLHSLAMQSPYQPPPYIQHKQSQLWSIAINRYSLQITNLWICARVCLTPHFSSKMLKILRWSPLICSRSIELGHRIILEANTNNNKISHRTSKTSLASTSIFFYKVRSIRNLKPWSLKQAKTWN